MSALDSYLSVHHAICKSWLSLVNEDCNCGLNEAILDYKDLIKTQEELIGGSNAQSSRYAQLRSDNTRLLKDLVEERNHSTKTILRLQKAVDEARLTIKYVKEEVDNFVPDDSTAIHYEPLVWCIEKLETWISANPKEAE